VTASPSRGSSASGASSGATHSCGLLLALLEDGVDGVGALGDHRLELVPVDLLGRRRAGVPNEVRRRSSGSVPRSPHWSARCAESSRRRGSFAPKLYADSKLPESWRSTAAALPDAGHPYPARSTGRCPGACSATPVHRAA